MCAVQVSYLGFACRELVFVFITIISMLTRKINFAGWAGEVDFAWQAARLPVENPVGASGLLGSWPSISFSKCWISNLPCLPGLKTLQPEKRLEGNTLFHSSCPPRGVGKKIPSKLDFEDFLSSPQFLIFYLLQTLLHMSVFSHNEVGVSEAPNGGEVVVRVPQHFQNGEWPTF